MMNIEDMSDVFSIFHDGGVKAYSRSGNDLQLQVDIRYLAQLVDPSFRSFRVTLCDVSSMEFTTWPKTTGEASAHLLAYDEIFAGHLDIIEGEVHEGKVKVICNQAAVGCNYCGGELVFAAKSVTVEDEQGRLYKVEELKDLAEKYWSAWGTRNA